MAAKRFSAEVLSAAYPGLTGFGFINAGSYKSVYQVMRRDGVAEVLKVICLPVAGTTEEELAIQQQEIGRARREVDLLRECRSPFVVKLGSVAPEIRELEGEACVIYTEELLPGRELKAAIGPSNLPQAGEIRRLLRCLVKAIQALWTEQRTVHRDIKPGTYLPPGWRTGHTCSWTLGLRIA